MNRAFFFSLLLPALSLAQVPPPPASQAEVNAGVNTYKYVTPKTLSGFGLQNPTNGITAAQGTNIASYVASTNVTSSTNLVNVLPVKSYVSPQAATAGTRGNASLPFSTLAGAVASSLPGDVININSNLTLTAQQGVTNLTLTGYYLTTPTNFIATTFNSINNPGILLDGGTVDSLVLTNKTFGNGASVVVGIADHSSGNVNNCVIYGPDYGIQFNQNGTTKRSQIRASTIYANFGIDLWRGFYDVLGCTIVATNGGVTFNDDCEARVANSYIKTGGSASATAITHFARSVAYIDSCLLTIQPNTPHSFVMIAASEPGGTPIGVTTYGIYNNDVFNLSYPDGGIAQLATYKNENGSGADVRLVFNYCYYSPATNNVIVDNGNAIVYVIGGNFVPANFSSPNNVIFGATNLYATALYGTAVSSRYLAYNVDVGYLNDLTGAPSVDIANRGLYDANANVAVDWNNDLLTGHDGSQRVDWFNKVLNGSWTVGGVKFPPTQAASTGTIPLNGPSSTTVWMHYTNGLFYGATTNSP